MRHVEVKMAAVIRMFKAYLTCCHINSKAEKRLLQQFVPKRNKWVYRKKEGVPREVMEWLHMDIDLSRKNIASVLKKYNWRGIKDDHKYISDRHRILGPDLATAHFLTARGAKVKFVDRETWFEKDEKGNMFLPNSFVPNLHLEAINASGVTMSYVAFDNMVHLSYLRYLNFSKSLYFNDWCMARLYQFKDTLEFLDISGCTEVTENGLACIHHLKKLKGLKLSDLPNVRDMSLMVLLLEESLPECTVFGVQSLHFQLPNSESSDSELSERLQTNNSDGKQTLT